MEVSLLHVVYEENRLVIKCKASEDECAGVKFGTLIDLDYVEYQAKEIHFHTPAEHEL